MHVTIHDKACIGSYEYYMKSHANDVITQAVQRRKENYSSCSRLQQNFMKMDQEHKHSCIVPVSCNYIHLLVQSHVTGLTPRR